MSIAPASPRAASLVAPPCPAPAPPPARALARAASTAVPNAREYQKPVFVMLDSAELSERRDGIHRRAGATANRQWGHGQQELPPLARRGGRGERLEIAIVEQVHTQAHEREIVHRTRLARDIRRRKTWRHITPEQRDVALLQPRNDR